MSGGSPPGTRTVLVTGASGFVGRHLVQRCLEAGHRVLATEHRTPLEPAMRAAGVQVVRADLDDEAQLARVIQQADVVFHFAGFVPSRMDDPAAARRTLEHNALLTLGLARATGAGRRFVYASAGQLYAPSRPVAAETDPVYPSGRAAIYLASKLAGEIYVEHLRSSRQLDAISLRIGCVYGTGMPPERVVARFMEQALAGRPLEVFAAGGHCDYVHVDDVVSLALRAGCGGAPGIYNAGTGVASSLMELATAVADVCQDRPVPVVARSPTGGPLPGFAALDITKAANAWGYAPLGLREGLMRYRRQLEARVSQP